MHEHRTVEAVRSELSNQVCSSVAAGSRQHRDAQEDGLLAVAGLETFLESLLLVVEPK